MSTVENEERIKRQSEILQEICYRVLEAHRFIHQGTQNNESGCFADGIDKLSAVESLIIELDNSVASNISFYAPNSKELREAVALLKITNEFERIANGARKFSRDIPKYLQDGFKDSRTYQYILELHGATTEAIHLAVKACTTEQAGFDYEHCLSQAVVEESKTDDLFAMLHKEIIHADYDDELFLRHIIELFNAIRRLERAADHAVNIIKLMIYAKRGGVLGELDL